MAQLLVILASDKSSPWRPGHVVAVFEDWRRFGLSEGPPRFGRITVQGVKAAAFEAYAAATFEDSKDEKTGDVVRRPKAMRDWVVDLSFVSFNSSGRAILSADGWAKLRAGISDSSGAVEARTYAEARAEGDAKTLAKMEAAMRVESVAPLPKPAPQPIAKGKPMERTEFASLEEFRAYIDGGGK